MATPDILDSQNLVLIALQQGRIDEVEQLLSAQFEIVAVEGIVWLKERDAIGLTKRETAELRFDDSADFPWIRSRPGPTISNLPTPASAANPHKSQIWVIP